MGEDHDLDKTDAAGNGRSKKVWGRRQDVGREEKRTQTAFLDANLRLKYVIQDEGVRPDAMLSIAKRRQSLKIRDRDSLERIGRRDFRNDSCSYGFVSTSYASTVSSDSSGRLSSLAGGLLVHVSFRTSDFVLSIRDRPKFKSPVTA
jgi:hypothetical protein